jgi:predicted acyltransferase
MNRFHSLDVFRGATVALMILVNNPGSWSYVYPPLEHAKWHGCTPTDLVFPFFLFAVGNAMAFVFKRGEGAGSSVMQGANFWKKVTKRFILIFLIGLVLNWFPFVKWDADGQLVMKPLENLRILGVLPRIALAYFFASIIIYLFKSKGAFVAGAILLLLYWWMCFAFGDPGDPYSLQGYFGTAIDKAILGETHMYHGEGIAFDPEGIMSTIPAIVQVIFGYLAGEYIITKGKNTDMLSNLFVTATLLIFTALIWDMAFPINKKIWTSSYVLYTTGLAMMILGVLIHWIELKGIHSWWTKFFDVFGKNPLFIYVLSGVWIKIYLVMRIPNGTIDGKPAFINGYAWLFEHVFQPLLGNYGGSLAFAISHVLLFWLIGSILDRKKIYIRV